MANDRTRKECLSSCAVHLRHIHQNTTNVCRSLTALYTRDTSTRLHQQLNPCLYQHRALERRQREDQTTVSLGSITAWLCVMTWEGGDCLSVCMWEGGDCLRVCACGRVVTAWLCYDMGGADCLRVHWEHGRVIVHWEHGRVVTQCMIVDWEGGDCMHDCRLGAWESGDCMIVDWEHGRLVTAWLCLCM